jgi:putative restriction endonuclease
MPADPLLYQRLVAALPETTLVSEPAPGQRWPIEADVPDLGKVRLYARTCTPDHAGRAEGEFAAQMTGFGGASRISRGALNLLGANTALLAFAPSLGVWAAWQPHNHREFANSKSLQINEADLEQARGDGWAVAPVRQTTDPISRETIPEVRVAFRPYLLPEFLRGQAEADVRGLAGEERAQFMREWPTRRLAAEVPLVDEDEVQPSGDERGRVAHYRLERSRTFALIVRRAFGEKCAVCGTQLGLIEAAHLIPITEPGCRDEAWNGLALCRNHHALFDAGAFVVNADLQVQVRKEFVVGLKAVGLDGGLNFLLGAINGTVAVEPNFWSHDDMRRRMQAALLQAAALRPEVRMPSRSAHRGATARVR